MRGIITRALVATAWTAAGLALTWPASAQTHPPGAPPASAREGTAPHAAGQRHRVWLDEGERIEAGTCGLEGAEVVGDTVLLLRDESGREVASNDDGCPVSLGSRITYVVPRGGAGMHTLVGACYQGGKCGGRMVYRVERAAARDEGSGLWLALDARGLVGVDAAGGGLLASFRAEVRTMAPLVLRVDAGPMGLVGGEHGGLLGGAAMITALVDWEWMAVGAGAGVGALGRHPADVSDAHAALLGLRARLGSPDSFHVAGELRGAILDAGLRTHSLRLRVRLPLDAVDLELFGVAGDGGVALGEAAAVIWVDRAADRPRLGVRVSAGAAGVFYEPRCRFGNPCGRTSWIAGPTVGAGIEWRP